jgi:hypothetical protein
VLFCLFQRVQVCHSLFRPLYSEEYRYSVDSTPDPYRPVSLRQTAEHKAATANQLARCVATYTHPTRPASCDPAFLVRHSPSAQDIATIRPSTATTLKIHLLLRHSDRIKRSDATTCRTPNSCCTRQYTLTSPTSFPTYTDSPERLPMGINITILLDIFRCVWTGRLGYRCEFVCLHSRIAACFRVHPYVSSGYWRYPQTEAILGDAIEASLGSRWQMEPDGRVLTIPETRSGLRRG